MSENLKTMSTNTTLRKIFRNELVPSIIIFLKNVYHYVDLYYYYISCLHNKLTYIYMILYMCIIYFI